MIEKIVVQLKKDQADQETQWDACRKDLADNAQNRLESKNHKDELKTKIDNLDADIKTLTGEIAELDASIANSLSELKKATETRNAENLEFQTVYSDQQATKALLNQGKVRLNQPKGGASVDNAPPADFGEYKKGAGG